MFFYDRWIRKKKHKRNLPKLSACSHSIIPSPKVSDAKHLTGCPASVKHTNAIPPHIITTTTVTMARVHMVLRRNRLLPSEFSDGVDCELTPIRAVEASSSSQSLPVFIDDFVLFSIFAVMSHFVYFLKFAFISLYIDLWLVCLYAMASTSKLYAASCMYSYTD